MIANEQQRSAAHGQPDEDFDPAEQPDVFWEDRYASSARTWSGKVNQALAEVADDLGPGSSLDLGCGEGADVIWLAEKGWNAFGVDLSGTAIQRAREAATTAGLAERASFEAADLTGFDPGQQFDLVTASFFHSPVALERTEILRRAAQWVAPGGRLLVISHLPPAAGAPKHHHLDLPRTWPSSTSIR